MGRRVTALHTGGTAARRFRHGGLTGLTGDGFTCRVPGVGKETPIRIWAATRHVLGSPWTRLLGTVAAAVLFARAVGIRRAVAHFGHLSGGWALVAVGLAGLSVVASVIEWGALLRGTGHSLAWRFLGGWYVRGLFVNQVLPTGVGGDAVRAMRVGRVTGRGPAVASLVGSRMAGTLAMAGWGLCGAVLLRALVRVPAVPGFTAFVALMLLAWGLALAGSRLGRHIPCGRGPVGRAVTGVVRPLAAALGHYRACPAAVAQSIIAGTVGWGLNLFSMQAFALALGVDIPWTVFALVLPVALLATFAPVAANGIGVREGLLVFLLTRFHVPLATAVALALFVDLQLVPFAAVGGVLHFLEGSRGWRRPTAAPAPLRLAE